MSNALKLDEARAKYRDNLAKATSMFKHLIIDPKYVGDMPQAGLLALSKNE
jgi:hypothetical protein